GGQSECPGARGGSDRERSRQAGDCYRTMEGCGTAMATTGSVLDVLVIGAGQAGLALGYQLKQLGQTFLIVDRHERIGESWRQRFDSLRLFTPRSYSGLPGLPVPGDPDGYPTKDEI